MPQQTGSVYPRALRLIPALMVAIAILTIALPAHAELRGIFFNGGDSVTSAISPEGDIDTLVFDAFADSKITLEVKAIQGSTLMPGMELLAPDGTTIDISSKLKEKKSRVTLKNFMLDVTGRYGVRVFGRSGTVGKYRLKSQLTPLKTKSSRFVLGPGKSRVLFFSAESETRIKVNITGNAGRVSVTSVRDPLDNEIPGATDLFESTASGEQVARLFPTRNTGDYTFTVTCDAEEDADIKVKIKTIQPVPYLLKRDISPIEPKVEAVVPEFGREFNGVTIEGSGFQPGTIVALFDDTEALSAFYVSPTQVNVIVPPEGDRSVVDIRVYNPDGQDGFKEQCFIYIPPPPDIISLTPTEGPDSGGTTVTVFGQYLTFVTTVTLGQDDVTSNDPVINEDGTQLTFRTDPHAPGITTLLLTDQFGQSDFLSSAFNFAAPPMIANSTPLAGTSKGGTSVMLTGSGFRADDVVLFGTAPATSTTLVSATQLFATAPAHPLGAVDLTVIDPWDRESVAPGGFEFVTGTLIDETNTRMPANTATENYGGRAAAIGEVHNDGIADRIDIVLGGDELADTRSIRLMENTGSKFELDAGQSFDGTAADDLVLGDLDGDGDLDLVVTSESVESYGGRRSYYVYYWYSSNYYYYKWYYLISEPYMSTRVFLNDGTGSFSFSANSIPKLSSADDDLLTGRALALGDVDGDNDLDIVVTSQNAPYVSTMYKYSTRQSYSWYYYYYYYTYYQDPTLTATRLLTNNGKAGFTNVSPKQLPSAYSGDLFAGHDVVVGDIDGDGDIDIVVTGDGDALREPGSYVYVIGSKTRILANDGTGTFTNETGTMMPFASEDDDWGGRGVGLGDLDGDDTLEIIITSDRDLTAAGVAASSTRVFKLDEDAGAFTDATAAFMPPVRPDGQGEMFKGIAIAVGDPDGNGTDEIFLLYDREVFEEDPNTGQFTRQVTSLRWLNKVTVLPMRNVSESQLPNPNLTGDFYLGHGIRLGDLDDDGDLDLVITTTLSSYNGEGGRPTRVMMFE